MSLKSINKGDKLVQISSSRLEELRRNERKLHALEAAGVDSWEGYEDAMEVLNLEGRAENELDTEGRD